MVQLQRVKGEVGLVLNLCPGFTALIEPLVCDAGEVEGISSNNRTDQGVVLTHNWATRRANRDGGNYRDYSNVEMKCNLFFLFNLICLSSTAGLPHTVPILTLFKAYF